ncbi:MAG: ATP phosphoribosyltransferase [Candidatus Hecatellales archaeon B24]|nr:MAG: ATP phosphoribosyltransferase [Candidatus Hecatellales archaeon B24]
MKNRQTELIIAVPSKGRLRRPTVRLLARAGISPSNEHSRSLYSPTVIPWLSMVAFRASDIPRLVESGAADLGITGYDFMVESGVKVHELLDLQYGFSRMVLAVPEGSKINSPKDLKAKVRIATKFPSIARRYLKSKGVEARIVKVSGAAEIAPTLGIAEAIIDITSTGATLRLHKLKVIDEILQSTARLIANEKALKAKRERIGEVSTALLSVLRARRKKLIMMNVPEEKLRKVVKLIPSMGGPTVARVESKPPMWEVYSVIDEEDVYQVINRVKAAGARDILVLPIERIVP